MIFFLLINVKMPTVVGILTFMSGKNSILGLSELKKKPNFSIFLYLCAFKISCLIELSMKKSFITSGPGCKTETHSLFNKKTTEILYEGSAHVNW